ncbi:hypothetical protein SAMN04489737_1046 [Arcanobacterium phocae]|uniref:Permease n=1 Tax=Arcanobacterium phocae TaxID=131112 RepID=A0A1H2LFY2_9ACTO|nr:permease [Arcanobacterium phocae]SDU79937.1 hypothetical protein SAMN04489737_1046 [Arcanobacterium phocae]
MNSPIYDVLTFFLVDTIKIFALLIAIIFALSFLRASTNMDKIRDFLAARGLFLGLFLAAVLGAVTPFCSCSSIPLFVGFISARVPIPIALTFLVSSPLISETAAVLIGIEFGWDVALAYVLTAVLLSMFLGWVASFLPLEKWVEDFVLTTPVGLLRMATQTPSLAQRRTAAWGEVKSIVGKVWPWIIFGVALGSVIHGWVPAHYFADYVTADNLFAVPLATILGTPLYANGGAVVPIGQALWTKGIPLGTVMSFMMGAIALSVPEAIMLRRVMKPCLLVLYFVTVMIGIMAIGYLFNIVYV